VAGHREKSDDSRGTQQQLTHDYSSLCVLPASVVKGLSFICFFLRSGVRSARKLYRPANNTGRADIQYLS